MGKKVGIVTVLYNSSGVLEGFYDSLSKQDYNEFVLYAIDNKSPDDSLDLIIRLKDSAPFKTVIIEAENNGGIAKGNNIGIERAIADQCELVLLANNDIEFASDAIRLLVEGLDKYGCDIIVPKIFNYFTGKLWCAGGGGYGYLHPVKGGGFNKDDAPRYNIPKSLEFAPSCFMLIKAKVFDIAGLMDERYFLYFDETDFIYRAIKKCSFKLHYEPAAVVVHKCGNATGSKPSPFVFYLNTRNRAYFMNKYFPWYQRLSINLYNFGYYFLYSMKHREYPSIFKNIGYYREGVKLYRLWLKEQKDIRDSKKQ